MLAVYGASGCGRGVLPIVRMQFPEFAVEQLVFIDDAAGPPQVNGHRVMRLADFASLEVSDKRVVIAIANGSIRQKLSDDCTALGLSFFEARAREHVRMDDCEIGEGAIFSPFTTVTSNIRIGRHFHCNLNSYVEHDCVIGDFVTFAPGVQCNGNVHIGDGAYIGAGAVIRQGRPGAPLRIGRGALVGMGAVVLNDVPANAVVAGNPARPITRSQG